MCYSQGCSRMKERCVGLRFVCANGNTRHTFYQPDRGHLNLPCFRKWVMLPCLQRYTRRFKHFCFSFLTSLLLLWSFILPVVDIPVVTTHVNNISGNNTSLSILLIFLFIFSLISFLSFPIFPSTCFFSPSFPLTFPFSCHLNLVI